MRRDVPFTDELNRCEPGVRRLAYALVGRAGAVEADVLTRDVFARARRAERFARSTNLRVWLLATLIGLNRARVRAGAPARRPIALDRLDPTEALAFDCREALLVVVIAGLTYAEAADALGASRASVAARVARARAALADASEAPERLSAENGAVVRRVAHLRVVK